MRYADKAFFFDLIDRDQIQKFAENHVHHVGIGKTDVQTVPQEKREVQPFVAAVSAALAFFGGTASTVVFCPPLIAPAIAPLIVAISSRP